MATYHSTSPALAGERSRSLIAPGGPVPRVVAAMAAHDDLRSPQLVASYQDRTAITIAASCIACWLASTALWFGGLL